MQRGDRVAFMLDNSPQFLAAWLGLAKIGGCLVAINTGFRHDEASYLVGDSEARYVLTSPDHLAQPIALAGTSTDSLNRRVETTPSHRIHYGATL